VLFVLCNSSCRKDNPRIRRSTSVSNRRVRQSCFVILGPGRDPVLGCSCVPDLSRRFGVASAILCVAAAVHTTRLVVPGLVALLGFVVLACLVADSGLVTDSGHVLGDARDADVSSVVADSSFCCRLHDFAKVGSLDGLLGHESHSFV
jgi:hypothetical protein